MKALKHEVKGGGYIRETLAGGPWEYGLVTASGASSGGAPASHWQFNRLGEAPSGPAAREALRDWWRRPPLRAGKQRKPPLRIRGDKPRKAGERAGGKPKRKGKHRG